MQDGRVVESSRKGGVAESDILRPSPLVSPSPIKGEFYVLYFGSLMSADTTFQSGVIDGREISGGLYTAGITEEHVEEHQTAHHDWIVYKSEGLQDRSALFDVHSTDNHSARHRSS